MKSLVALAAFNALSLSAQISGVVLDPTGARVPGATVIATDGAGPRITTVALADGSYSFANLAAGRYDLAVRQPGFTVFHADDVSVGGKSPVRVDARLIIGRMTESLVVTAAGTPRPQEAPAGPQRLRVGGSVQAAKLLMQVRPSYPAEMKEQRLEGVVVLQAVISKEGVPLSLNSQSPETNRAFVDAAIEAVKQWRYQPTLLNGEPVEVITTITINFTLAQ